MKNKMKINTILLALMIILVPLTSTATQAPLTSTTTQAWTRYTFEMTQDPKKEDVRAGNIITISITRTPDSGDNMEQVLIKESGIYTRLYLSRNDADVVFIYPDQILPTLLNPITFTIGPFDDGDGIVYEIRLVLNNAWDFKGSGSFVVEGSDIPIDWPEWAIYALIGAGVLVVLLVLAYLFKKKRAR